MVVAIIGPSGSGKDTQAANIAKHYDVHIFSTGAVMRDQSAKGNPVAIKAQEYANAGHWSPDELVLQLMSDYIKQECPNGFVVTGFPRMLPQFLMFDDFLEDLKLNWDAIIHIKLDDETAIHRMERQAHDAELTGQKRPDATPELMRERLKSYHETINPILAETRKRGILFEIDGSRTRTEIFSSIKTILEEQLKKKKVTR